MRQSRVQYPLRKMVSSTEGTFYSFQETDSKVDMARDGVFPSREQK